MGDESSHLNQSVAHDKLRIYNLNIKWINRKAPRNIIISTIYWQQVCLDIIINYSKYAVESSGLVICL